MPMGWKFTRSNGTDWRTGEVDYRASVGKELVYPGNCEVEDACGYHLGKTLRGAGEYAKPEAIFKCSYSRRDVLGEDEHEVRVSRLRVLEEVPAWKGYGPRGRRVQAFIESLGDIPWFAHVGEPFVKPPWAKEMKQVDGWAAAGIAAVDTAGIAAVDTARAGAGIVARARAGVATQAAAWAAAGEAATTAARAAAGAAAMTAARPAARAAAWAASRARAGFATRYAAWAAAGEAAGEAVGIASIDATWVAIEIMGGITGYFSQLMEVYRAGHYPVSWDGRRLVVY